MAYNEFLADRIRSAFRNKRVRFEEKKMMGGLCFLVNGKMCIGVEKEKLMARIGPDVYKQVLNKKGCREMDFTGRPMKGFVFIEPEGTDSDKDLEFWVNLSLDYNPKARSSRKK